MPFGPDITVATSAAELGYVLEITLTEFGIREGRDIFPFASPDPSLRFLGEGERVVARDSQEFYETVVGDVFRVVWGIKAAGQLMGFVTLSSYESGDSPNYMIALSRQARGRRIGSLATAGVVHATFTQGLLHQANGVFNSSIATLETVIHPENYASQAMCERVGFVQGRSYIEFYEGRRYPWIEYHLERDGVQVVAKIEEDSVSVASQPAYSVIADV